MHWIGCLATLKYEVCNHIFVLWVKVHDVFNIIPEYLALIGVGWPTHRCGSSKVSQCSRAKLFGWLIGRYIQHGSVKGKMGYLRHLVISTVVIWLVNHFAQLERLSLHAGGIHSSSFILLFTSRAILLLFTSAAVNRSPTGQSETMI